MKKLKMTSNVKNRVQKVRDSLVYGDTFSVVDEVIIQNPKRAGSSIVSVRAEDDTIVITDNGSGCANPEVLFTLDVSGFGNEGFGEGFTSIYMIADFFEVRTLDWKGHLHVEEALQSDAKELEVQIEPNPYTDGFELELRGKKVREYLPDLIDYTRKAAAFIPDVTFVINGVEVEKQSIFDVRATSPYFEFFHNRKYEGQLSLARSYHESYIKVYYEHRYVTEISFFGLSGSVLLKPKAVNLRTPDRRDIVRDDKYWEFKDRLKRDLKKLMKDMIKNGDAEELTVYSEVVSEYMKVEEYMPYLTIDADSILNKYEMRNKVLEETGATEETPIQYQDVRTEGQQPAEPNIPEDLTDFQQEQAIEVSHHEESSSEVKASHRAVNVIIDPSDMPEQIQFGDFDSSFAELPMTEEKRDTKRARPDKKMSSFVTGKVTNPNFAKKNDMEKVSIKNIRKKKNVVWVEKSNKDSYKSLIDKYEYYGVFTFVSPHLLYDKALYHIGIPHISSLEGQAIQKDYKVTKIGAQTKKEERVMEILGFVEKVLGLGETFNISTIECKMIVELRETKIYQEKLHVAGYAQGRQIHLNRKDIDFGNISSVYLGKNSFSIHDIKFILANLDTIAHEAAHVIYGTEDNTKEHFEKQIDIQNVISKAVMSADKLW